MRSVDEHLARVLAALTPLAPVEVELADAHGRVLAADVTAPASLPRFDNSAMDGYAVRVADVQAASPDTAARLEVVGDLPAGPPPAAYSVEPGHAVRIMTGAPVPPGTEAVVPVELTDGAMTTVIVTGSVREGQHIRRSGEDVVAGEQLLAAGQRLGPAQVSLLAAAGLARAPVRPAPRVAVLSTGSELVEPGRPVGPGQISESNSYFLVAALTEAGAVARRVSTVGDDPQALLAALTDAATGADLVVTSGGVSAGAYDVVKEVLSRAGTVRFDRVAMQPGMPQGAGTLRGGDGATVPVVTLPGNPVSVAVSFEVFVRPALRCLQGVQPVQPPPLRAVVADEVRSTRGKRQFLRARLTAADGRLTVRTVGGRGSHLLKDLTRADALLVVPEPVDRLDQGELADVLPLRSAP